MARQQNTSRYQLNFFNFGGNTDVLEINAEEALSELYHYDITFVVENTSTQPDIVGLTNTPLGLRIDPEFADNDDSRLVHGIIQWCQFIRGDDRYHYYQLRLVPQLWRLTQQSDNRMFQEMDVQSIITQVLSEAGFAGDEYQFIFQEQHPVREYCVQYRETHLEFLERLMAEEGIYYTFTHSDKQHVLVMADTPTVEFPIKGDATVPFHPIGGPEPQYETIQQFGLKQETRTGQFVHTHYDFKRPALELEQTYQADLTVGGEDKLEQYDYFGRYIDPKRGANLDRFRLDEHRADALIGTGESNSVRLQTGLQFSLAGHELPSHNDKFLITRLRIQARQPQVLKDLAGTIQSGHNAASSSDASYYKTTFTCIPYTVPFRPPYDCKKPQVHGPHTAIVVGPKDEEIYVDEHGRVKVQFHWDRISKDRSPKRQGDEFSSVWMRVSQGWAGAGWGQMFIPRIGHEVIVDFLEGDIDRPIITGRVYHGTNVPPYTLPKHKTVSTMMSDTHKGEGFNEIRFEDEAGIEQIYVHGQKDEDKIIENDRREHVKNDRSLIVNRDKFEEVRANRHERIKVDHVEQIDKDQHQTTNGNFIKKVVKDFSRLIGGNFFTRVAGDRSTHVNGFEAKQVDASQSTVVNNEQYARATNIIYEAGTELTIKGPGGFVKIDAGGVTIVGLKVKINEGGTPGVGTERTVYTAQEPMQPSEPHQATDFDKV